MLCILAYLLCVARAEEITVATLNIGHGRGSGPHQIWQSSTRIQHNIDDISNTLGTVDIDLLALQEADHHAWWSGYSSQTQRLSELLDMPHYVQGLHSQATRLVYGTSLLSKLPFVTTRSVSLTSTFPLPSKGFSLGELVIDSHTIVVVSIHLDPLKRSRRLQQVMELESALSSVSHPIIILGDFNVHWGRELQQYCSILNVQPYLPSEVWISYPKLGTRLDWVLTSKEFEVLEYRTVSANISDHNAIVAKLMIH